MLRKAGANWVEGDRFHDREADLAALTERVQDGTHTLLTAQRRMGKTSLVREVLRVLSDRGEVQPIFVDLESASNAEDAIAEIAAQSRHAHDAWARIKSGFVSVFRDIGERVDSLSISEIQVKLRAGIDSGNWRQKGDEIFSALAGHDQRVVLAIDEFSILINRILKGSDYRITPERREAADVFLSWLRRNGQLHKGQVMLLLSGSVGLGPILRQAELSAQANIYSSYELRPWDQATASGCLAELSRTYKLDLPPEVRDDMCRRLRWLVPHHVQQFFECLHDHLRRDGRTEASLQDVKDVYFAEMLGSRGQISLDHYEGRLKLVLGTDCYEIALDLLAEAAVHDGRLSHDAVARYREYFRKSAKSSRHAIDTVLNVLEHDGFLERTDSGYAFLSGLLQDWWRLRHGGSFVPIERRYSEGDRIA